MHSKSIISLLASMAVIGDAAQSNLRGNMLSPPTQNNSTGLGQNNSTGLGDALNNPLHEGDKFWFGPLAEYGIKQQDMYAGDWNLRFQDDGNVVVYNGAGQATWDMNNWRGDVDYAGFKNGWFEFENCRLKLVGRIDAPGCGYIKRCASPDDEWIYLFETKDFGDETGCTLRFQDDGNLVIYDRNNQARLH